MHLIKFFILILLHSVRKIGMCGLLYVLTYSLYSYAEVNSHIEVRLDVILQVELKTKF